MKTNKAFNTELRQLLLTQHNWTVRNDFSRYGDTLISPCNKVALLLDADIEKGSVIGCCGRYDKEGLNVVECLPANPGTFRFENGQKVNLLAWSEDEAISKVAIFLFNVGIDVIFK